MPWVLLPSKHSLYYSCLILITGAPYDKGMQKGVYFKLSVEDTLHRKNPDPPLHSPQREEWKDGRGGARTKVLCEPLLGATGAGCLSRGGQPRAAGDGQTGRTLPVLMGTLSPCAQREEQPPSRDHQQRWWGGGDKAGPRWSWQEMSVSWSKRGPWPGTDMATAQLR